MEKDFSIVKSTYIYCLSVALVICTNCSLLLTANTLCHFETCCSSNLKTALIFSMVENVHSKPNQDTSYCACVTAELRQFTLNENYSALNYYRNTKRQIYWPILKNSLIANLFRCYLLTISCKRRLIILLLAFLGILSIKMTPPRSCFESCKFTEKKSFFDYTKLFLRQSFEFFRTTENTLSFILSDEVLTIFIIIQYVLLTNVWIWFLDYNSCGNFSHKVNLFTHDNHLGNSRDSPNVALELLRCNL